MDNQQPYQPENNIPNNPPMYYEGYNYPPQQPILQSQQHITTETVTYSAPPPPTIVIKEETQPLLGNCPVCKEGVLTKSFGCCGLCLGIVCFPIGLICCILHQDTVCVSCGYRMKALCC